MEGKIVKEIKFESAVTVKSVDEKGIEFSNGLVVTDYHDQDCCENVYADWRALLDTGFMKERFQKLIIKGIEDGGIGLNEYFVPCYNQQNGYYSSNLSIIVKGFGKKEIIDISGFVEDKIEP